MSGEFPEIAHFAFEVICGLATCGMLLVTFVYKRGATESGFAKTADIPKDVITRSELERMEERMARTYAREDLVNQRFNAIKDLTSQRMDLLEERMDEGFKTMHQSMSELNTILRVAANMTPSPDRRSI